MRARTLGHVSAGPLAAQATILAQNLPWLVHTPSQLSVSCFYSPLESLRPNTKVWLQLRLPLASRPTPITPETAELAGSPPSSPVSIPPSPNYQSASGIYFKGTTHSISGCCPPPLSLATLRRMTAPRGQGALALRTGWALARGHPSAHPPFFTSISPKIKPFLFASYTRALQPSLVEKLGLLQPFAQSGGGGRAPPTCPLPTGSIPPPFGEGSSGYSPPPHLTLVPLFAAIPVRGAADTKEGGTGREGEGSGGGE